MVWLSIGISSVWATTLCSKIRWALSQCLIKTHFTKRLVSEGPWYADVIGVASGSGTAQLQSTLFCTDAWSYVLLKHLHTEGLNMNLKNTVQVRSIRLVIINCIEILLLLNWSQDIYKVSSFCSSKSNIDSTMHYTESLQYSYCLWLYYIAKYIHTAVYSKGVTNDLWLDTEQKTVKPKFLCYFATHFHQFQQISHIKWT